MNIIVSSAGKGIKDAAQEAVKLWISCQNQEYSYFWLPALSSPFSQHFHPQKILWRLIFQCCSFPFLHFNLIDRSFFFFQSEVASVSQQPESLRAVLCIHSSLVSVWLSWPEKQLISICLPSLPLISSSPFFLSNFLHKPGSSLYNLDQFLFPFSITEASQLHQRITESVYHAPMNSSNMAR